MSECDLPTDNQAWTIVSATRGIMADNLIYKNLEALEPIKRLIKEAALGVNDPVRTIDTSSMKEVLGASLGAGAGGVLSFVALYSLGTVGLSGVGITTGLAAAGLGGGMVAGVFVLALPVAILGVVGF